MAIKHFIIRFLSDPFRNFHSGSLSHSPETYLLLIHPNQMILSCKYISLYAHSSCIQECSKLPNLPIRIHRDLAHNQEICRACSSVPLISIFHNIFSYHQVQLVILSKIDECTQDFHISQERPTNSIMKKITFLQLLGLLLLLLKILFSIFGASLHITEHRPNSFEGVFPRICILPIYR